MRTTFKNKLYEFSLTDTLRPDPVRPSTDSSSTDSINDLANGIFNLEAGTPSVG